MIIETPSREEEVILSIFSTLPISLSNLFVINFSVSSADAPRSTVETTPTGITTSGDDSFGIDTREKVQS